MNWRALNVENKWLFYMADAYSVRVALTEEHHPVHELAILRADDNNLRIDTLDNIRKLIKDNPEIEDRTYKSRGPLPDTQGGRILIDNGESLSGDPPEKEEVS